MASIQERNGSYQIKVSNGRDLNGKQIIETATFTPDPNKTKKQNEKALKKFALDFEETVKAGELLKGDKVTFAKYSELWLAEYAEKQMEKTSAEKNLEYLKRYILPYMGHMKLGDIKPLDIKAVYGKLQERGLSASTVKRVNNTISSMLSCAVDWQLIKENPCRRVKTPKEERKQEVKHFTPDEALNFLNYIEEPYTAKHGGRGEKMKDVIDIRREPLQLITLFNLALYTGARKGELLALKWEDIDFENHIITINKSLAKTTRDGYFLKTTKNKTSDREVSIPDECERLLKRLKLEQKERSFSLGSEWQGQGNIFTRENGYYMDIATPRKSLQRIIRRYNETHEDKLPVIPFHGLRHTSATLLITQSDIDIKTVSARLGHADVSTTLNIYTHALKERDEKACEALTNILKRHA